MALLPEGDNSGYAVASGCAVANGCAHFFIKKDKLCLPVAKPGGGIHLYPNDMISK